MLAFAFTSFTSTQVVMGLLLALFLVVATIIGTKYYLRRITRDLENNPLQNRKKSKYDAVDVFHWSGIFFKLGLAITLFLTALAFNWTSWEKEVYIPENALRLDEEIEVETPRSQQEKPPPPPPPPPTITEVPNTVEVEEDDNLFLDQSIDVETEIVDAPKATQASAPPPPPPPPPEEPEEAPIFKIVEDMPRFAGCENVHKKEERDQCSQQKLLEFIYSNIKYPQLAKETRIEGVVVVQFVVEKDGSITDVKVVRDIGGGCGEEAMRVVKMMPKWIPGKQRGRPVRVLFNLPIRFQLV